MAEDLDIDISPKKKKKNTESQQAHEKMLSIVT